MTDVDTLIRRINQEVEVDVASDTAAWSARLRTFRDQGPQLQRYEVVAKHLIDQTYYFLTEDTCQEFEKAVAAK